MTLSFPTLPVVSLSSLNIRLLYLLLCVMAGIYTGFGYSSSPRPDLISDIFLWGTIGLAIGCIGLWMEQQLRRCPKALLIGGCMGILVGMAGSGLFILGMGLRLPQVPVHLTPWAMLLAVLICPYLGLTAGLHICKTYTPSLVEHQPASSQHRSRASSTSIQKILDSSAIIDGRIRPLCTTGFLSYYYSSSGLA